MPLSLRDTLNMLVPPSLYYRRRIAEETRSGEPELAILPGLFRRGGVAIDAGANLGFFSFALSGLADRVIAFEPNPDCARFARWMLRGRAEVQEVALSDAPGCATFYLPLSDEGDAMHFAGNLKRTHSHFQDMRTYEVNVRTLDSYDFRDVRFLKADVEGSEREVLDGARQTIERDRPALLLELLSGTHDDPGGYAEAICQDFGYDAFIVQQGKITALSAIAPPGSDTNWVTKIETRNVLFLPHSSGSQAPTPA
jgi:FkbM family methyltransferase